MTRDEYEKKKKWLDQYRHVFKEIAILEQNIRECREEQIAISIKYDGMPHGNSEPADLSRYIERLEELMINLVSAKKKAAAVKCDIEKRIQNIESPEQRNILRLRYTELLYNPREKRYFKRSWKTICREMGYEDAQIYRLHRRALENLTIS